LCSRNRLEHMAARTVRDIAESEKFEGAKIYLRRLTQTDVNETYLSWMHDKAINQFLESRWQEQTLSTLRDFVKSMNDSNENLVLAIVEKSGRHVGNIKIGPIHKIYRTADLGYFIGPKECWGKGYATEAIALCCQIAIQELGLRRLQAGFMAGNEGSKVAIERNGFTREACFRKKILAGSTWVDHIIYGKLFET
jgi:ribosomal-protein-alanine N-acetyltransferase